MGNELLRVVDRNTLDSNELLQISFQGPGHAHAQPKGDSVPSGTLPAMFHKRHRAVE